jgi:hypothetical protein
MMIVEQISIISGNVNEMELDVTIEQLERWLNGREKVQYVFPHLTATEREFLITGMSEAEQNKFYSSFEKEDI